MRADALVLGAGMVGVCTALQLARRGWSVALVDRRAPGRETSYGNAGIIQREAVEPYPFPRDLPTLLKVIRKGGIDVNYHATALPHLLPSLFRYWQASAPTRYARIAQEWARLIEHCLSEHEILIHESGADALVRREGWRQGYRTEKLFREGIERAARLSNTFGIQYTVHNSVALARAEPGLLRPMAGAIHWTEPWTVRDPGALVAHYADLFVRLGGHLFEGDAATLQPHGSGWRVTTPDGPLDAQHAVIALGPWARQATRALGYRLPLFIKRGYHRHYAGELPLTRPLLDVAHGVMLVPMNAGLRITTGAEFAQHEAPPTPLQLDKAERVARELIPLGPPLEEKPWLGARPCTPDMKPVIGPAPRHANLWFHFGHAHQGFTLGPASARLLAELMCGEPPYLDPQPYSAQRFE
ncbi:D-amino-acid dehydrogenase [Pseudomonas duriflava]|uniref:D-amino-acid dehydrogenase n=1 Tax=Pseudomonas duriflava TaxID=459528 RepID=A0A562QN69_9PSED|nr:FAD-dependent oxidoreductase [Pseudomonas duriflava]TWI57506.1 D-amino-acid dehydrogenase [Pseudomonas duriflava]